MSLNGAMKRIAIILAGISLLLSFATATLWVRSYFQTDWITLRQIERPARREFSDKDQRLACRRIESFNGRLQYIVRRYRKSPKGELSEFTPPLLRAETRHVTILLSLVAMPLALIIHSTLRRHQARTRQGFGITADNCPKCAKIPAADAPITLNSPTRT
ncbi:MAG: hypothetical protein JWP03_1235 [Phycisphaerales bacterium]|jgi:hypothetical protein|nr:hypothetical protein [Phycisphaerales bacterium]